MSAADLPLAGLRVWVTRPAHQAAGWCQALEAAGAETLRQPLLAIMPPADPNAAIAALQQAAAADVLLFTSTNAVAGAWSLLPDFEPRGRVYAVGRGSADALAGRLAQPVAVPRGDWTSEGLLADPGLAAPAGQTVAIITGAGGRDKLRAALSQRGARVILAPVYRREGAALAPARLAALVETADAIVVTSGGGLARLATLASSAPERIQAALFATQLVVPSSRVVKQALDLGFTVTPLAPARMEQAALVDVLARWAAGARARAGANRPSP